MELHPLGGIKLEFGERGNYATLKIYVRRT